MGEKSYVNSGIRCLVVTFCWMIVGGFERKAFSQFVDNFANRPVLTGSSLTLTGTLAGATFEAGEPGPCGYPGSSPTTWTNSVWCSWIPAQSTSVTLVAPLDFSVNIRDTHLLFSVFSGTNLTSLSFLGCNSFVAPGIADHPRPPMRYVTFSATAGIAYQIQVDGDWTNPFTLQLLATNPPIILTQPIGTTVSPLGSAALWVEAAGSPGPILQWLFNGAALPGQTAPTLLLRNLTQSTAGSYSVIASNSGGSVESVGATVSVTQGDAVPTLTALSPTNLCQLSFILNGQPYRGYGFEASSNLLNWFGFRPTSLNCSGPTNETTVLSSPFTGWTNHFIRAYLDVSPDICIAQLQLMDAAAGLWAVEQRQSQTAVVFPSDLQPYFPGGAVIACPGGGYYSPWLPAEHPTCSLSTACPPHIVPGP